MRLPGFLKCCAVKTKCLKWNDKKMILSASRRTDIPCFFSDWFMNRIAAGYVCVRNPMNHAQISRIALSPGHVDCIVFWTKDAKNIMEHLPALDRLGYSNYFQFTLTPYDNTIERNLRDKSGIIETFAALSSRIGKGRVVWRYDPIILNEMMDIAYHKEHFERLCDMLHGYTESVTVSFVDSYSKLKTNAIRPVTPDEMTELSDFIGLQAKAHGLRVAACCEDMDLSAYGIGKSSCIDRALIERICGYKLDTPPDRNQREGCGCAASVDIGCYNTCRNGCVYCYANYSESSVIRNCINHHAGGDLLIGAAQDGEKITSRKVKSDRIDG
jgi:hypothetical protein